ncbi:MAG: diphthine synthase [Thermoplasmata archaeon]
MAKLIFIGLGLGDEKGITLKGQEAAKACDILFMENYTSILEEGSIPKLEKALGKKINILNRSDVEMGGTVLEKATIEAVGFLVPGDAMSATTHVDMRLRAHALGIETEVIGGVSAFTAIPAMLGLQNYKFGRTVTVPLPEPNYRPISFYEKAHDNFKLGMHTLCLLDIQQDKGKYMTANQALDVLEEIEEELDCDFMIPDRLVCVVARAGSKDCLARAGYLKDMLKEDYGPPLHSIVIPGELHFLEAKALVELAGAPRIILEED